MIDLMNNNYFDNLIESLAVDSPLTEIEQTNETTYQYSTRSYLAGSDIKKIPNVIEIKKNKITNFITELIFVCDKELTESCKKKYGLRRSFKL